MASINETQAITSLKKIIAYITYIHTHLTIKKFKPNQYNKKTIQITTSNAGTNQLIAITCVNLSISTYLQQSSTEPNIMRRITSYLYTRRMKKNQIREGTTINSNSLTVLPSCSVTHYQYTNNIENNITLTKINKQHIKPHKHNYAYTRDYWL